MGSLLCCMQARRRIHRYQKSMRRIRPRSQSPLYNQSFWLPRRYTYPILLCDKPFARSTWALLSRAVLLFWTCVKQVPKMRAPLPDDYDNPAHGQALRDFDARAWMELIALDEAVDSHTCNIEQSTLYQVSGSFSVRSPCCLMYCCFTVPHARS